MKTKLLSFALLALVLVTGCESDQPHKPKPVPPKSDISELPWNRPRSWEAGAGFGGLMPQSH